MCTLGIGAKTVFTRERLATFSRTHGPENDFAVEVINRIIGLRRKTRLGRNANVRPDSRGGGS